MTAAYNPDEIDRLITDSPGGLCQDCLGEGGVSIGNGDEHERCENCEGSGTNTLALCERRGERLAAARAEVERMCPLVQAALNSNISWMDLDDAVDAYCAARDKAGGVMANVGTYIASRASLPERSASWRRLRDVDGWKITCSWIDESGAGETPDLGALWCRIEAEVSGSERLILYVEPEDFPLKGALIEVGMALACRIPIRVVAPGVVLDPVSFRPIGSWVRHPLVTFCDTMDEALEGATVCM